MDSQRLRVKIAKAAEEKARQNKELQERLIIETKNWRNKMANVIFETLVTMTYHKKIKSVTIPDLLETLKKCNDWNQQTEWSETIGVLKHLSEIVPEYIALPEELENRAKCNIQINNTFTDEFLLQARLKLKEVNSS